MSMDDVKPFDYCRDAVRDRMESERNLAFSVPFSAYVLRNNVQMSKNSQQCIDTPLAYSYTSVRWRFNIRYRPE